MLQHQVGVDKAMAIKNTQVDNKTRMALTKNFETSLNNIPNLYENRNKIQSAIQNIFLKQKT